MPTGAAPDRAPEVPARHEASRVARAGHDLESLALLLGGRGFPVPVAPRDLRRLNPYAVEFRYDEQPPELVTLAEADAIAAAVMRWAEALVADARLGSAADDGD